MAQHTIIIRDNNGAGRTGLEVKLKKYDNGIFVDYATATEIEGKPGVYAFLDIPYARYKLFINDVQEPSWDNGSDDGRWFGGAITKIENDVDVGGNRITGLQTNQGENTNPADAAAVGLVMGVNSYIGQNYLKKANDTLKGPLSAGGNRITDLPIQDENTNPADAAAVGLIMGVNSYIGQNYFHIPSNIIIVDSSISAPVLGRKYTKIQDAINYAQTQTPSVSNQYNIFIFPSKTATGYLENITLQPYIHLNGIGKPLITGIITGGNSNTRIRNLSFTYLGNYSLSSIHASDSLFRVMNDDTGNILTITNCILNNCGLLNVGQTEFNPTIVSAGGNIFLNCCSNISCNLQSTDKGSIVSIESVTTDFS